MMRVTLQIDGREIAFSEKDLTNIVKKYLSNVTKQVASTKVGQKPTEDYWFEVNPLEIDQKIFQDKREDERQERTRQLILKAFAQLESNSQKYGKKFKTMIPKKCWSSTTIGELKLLACALGDHMADWVEQSLEWAQRITNGESWEDICNKADTANWYRVVEWENNYVRYIGGSANSGENKSVSNVMELSCFETDVFDIFVPLVVSY